MKAMLRRWPLFLLGGVAIVASALISVPGCVASGGAYVGDDGEYYYGAPGYVVYDGWGPTYYVGPPRGGRDHHDDHHDDHQGHDGHGGDGHQRQPAYRPAPSSHSAPSIPTQSRPPSRSPGKNRE